MRHTSSKMRMSDIVTIDTIVFEIVGGGGLLKPSPPPGLLTFSNTPDLIGLMIHIHLYVIMTIAKNSDGENSDFITCY